MMLSNRNYFIDALKSKMKYEIESKHAEETYKECMEHFGIIHVLNYCMFTEAQKAFDILDERGALRHKIKMLSNKCEKSWEQYHNYMRKNMSKSGYGVIVDYCIQAHANVEQDLTYIRIAAHNVFLKYKIKDADVCAQLVASVCIGDLLESLWVSYFKLYQRRCGLDFSRYFQYANLKDVYKNIKNAFDVVYHTKDEITLIYDKSYQNAYNSLGNKITSLKFLDDAAVKAIQMSKETRELYAKELAQLEEVKNQSTIDALSNKYKVSKLK